MREKKIKIFIGILLALITFASSVALIMYSKQSELNKQIENQVAVYVASRDIVAGEYIGAGDVVLGKLPKNYIGSSLLTKEEIISRYAKIDIFANEPFRPQKLTLQKPIEPKGIEPSGVETKENEILEQLSSDTISISLEVFKNLDASLKKGDLIDIVSVFPTKDKQGGYEFSAKYIALNLKISSFRKSAKEMQNITATTYDETTKKNNTIIADTMILEISPLEIKNFLSMYYMAQELNSQRVYATTENRGHLWMVKCSDAQNKELQSDKNTLLLKEKVAKTKIAVPKEKERVKIFYED